MARTLNNNIPDFRHYRKNRLINGNFNVAQRGTSFTNVGASNAQYTLDRWKFTVGGASRYTVTQDTQVTNQTLVPPNGQSISTMKIACTTAVASPTSTDVIALLQSIENLNYSICRNQTCTISFWINSSVTGSYGVVLILNNNGTSQYVTEVTVNNANTWEFKTITYANPSFKITSSVSQIDFAITLVAGSALQIADSSLNTFQSLNRYGSSRQVNFGSSTSNVMYLSQIQLEVGSEFTEFEQPYYNEELAACQRFYYTLGKGISFPLAGFQGTGNLLCFIPFPVVMRNTPNWVTTLTDGTYSAPSPSSGQWMLFQQGSAATKTGTVTISNQIISQFGHGFSFTGATWSVAPCIINAVGTTNIGTYDAEL